MNRDQYKNRMDTFQGHYVHPDDLRIGLYVQLDLGWMDHPFTFSNFLIKDEDQINKIRALKLDRIRYDPLRSEVVPDFPKTIQTNWIKAEPAQPEAAPAPKPPAQRSDRLKQLNDVILQSEKTFAKNATTAREAVRNLIDQPTHSVEVAEALIEEMIESVITESSTVLHAVSQNNRDQVSFIHPLNVTVLSLMLAKVMNISKEEAAEVGVAALFHDVGKEDRSQNKSFVDLHCEIGAREVLRAGLSERVSKIILQHHEYIDGSGMPNRLKDAQIDPLARIVCMANHFDNLCNPQNMAEAMTPFEALSQMFALQSKKFDASLLQLMVKLLGVYPPGSVVQLSNGDYGVVLTVNPNKPLLPLIQMYAPEVARETPVVIDLSEKHGVTIKKCLRPAQLPPEVYDYLRPSKRVSYYFIKPEDLPGPALGATPAQERKRA